MRTAPPELHLARQARVRSDLEAASVDALLVTSLPNIAYLTGLFATAGALIVSRDRVILIVDGRYAISAKERRRELPSLEVVTPPTGGNYEEAIAATAGTFANGRVGFEETHLTVRQHRDLTTRVAAIDTKIELFATHGIVERSRVVKDAWELRTLSKAASRLSDAAKCIIPKALAGQSERGVAGAIEAELRRVGFQKPAFDTIVASGPNSAVPHHRAGDRRLEVGDLVILDFGGMLDGYAVDMTRTIAVGGADTRQQRLLEQVAAAQAAAFEAIAVGRPASEVDSAARDVLTRDGLGEAFSHGTGHGLGLEVHERPRLTKYRPELPPEPLAAGMVFTLEPGAYLEGWGGVRIEDDVVVTAAGAEWLTDVPRIPGEPGQKPL
jgi:Xaa-Pro aminopeptidase